MSPRLPSRKRPTSGGSIDTALSGLIPDSIGCVPAFALTQTPHLWGSIDTALSGLIPDSTGCVPAFALTQTPHLWGSIDTALSGLIPDSIGCIPAFALTQTPHLWGQYRYSLKWVNTGFRRLCPRVCPHANARLSGQYNSFQQRRIGGGGGMTA